ncbi:hypothetical protein EAI25_01925 [Akkermansia muciniphila]|nr:hypothetical protein [Akkermansia muciniphila]
MVKKGEGGSPGIQPRQDFRAGRLPLTGNSINMPLPAGGGCAGRSPDEPGDGVMTVPEYSMKSGEIFLKREEKAGKFLFEVFSRVFPLVATA